jgi:hypothetical protein
MPYPLVGELAGDGVPVTVTCRVVGIARQPYRRWLANPSPAELDGAYRAVWRIFRDTSWWSSFGRPRSCASATSSPAATTSDAPLKDSAIGREVFAALPRPPPSRSGRRLTEHMRMRAGDLGQGNIRCHLGPPLTGLDSDR